MHTVYNIVHEVLVGTIEVQSAMGKGTHLMVAMPRVAPLAVTPAAESDLRPLEI